MAMKDINNSATPNKERLGLMLAALTSVFVLSHAFRTTIAVASDPLAADLVASTTALGAIAGSFHLAFALAQPIVGIALDRYGPRRTVIVGFALAILGSLVSAAATSTAMLIGGQWLIGVGCSPALLAAMVFIARRYEPGRFAALSGVVFAVGGVGMLLTGTPLAWILDMWSWRVGFAALAVLSALSWLAVFICVQEEPQSHAASGQSLRSALADLGSIIRQPHTLGICCLAATSYAAFLALRGLWLGPMLADRYAFSLVEIGHVALAVSLAGIAGPLLFGRADPGGRARRTLITGCSAVYAAFFVVHAFGVSAPIEVALITFNGLFAGFITLQYADLRSAYPTTMTGRALSVFTMAMFAGVAAVQSASGAAASLAPSIGIEPVRAAMLTVSVLLALGTLAFWLLPRPPNLLSTEVN